MNESDEGRNLPALVGKATLQVGDTIYDPVTREQVTVTQERIERLQRAENNFVMLTVMKGQMLIDARESRDFLMRGYTDWKEWAWEKLRVKKTVAYELIAIAKGYTAFIAARGQQGMPELETRQAFLALPDGIQMLLLYAPKEATDAKFKEILTRESDGKELTPEEVIQEYARDLQGTLKGKQSELDGLKKTLREIEPELEELRRLAKVNTTERLGELTKKYEVIIQRVDELERRGKREAQWRERAEEHVKQIRQAGTYFRTYIPRDEEDYEKHAEEASYVQSQCLNLAGYFYEMYDDLRKMESQIMPNDAERIKAETKAQKQEKGE